MMNCWRLTALALAIGGLTVASAAPPEAFSTETVLGGGLDEGFRLGAPSHAVAEGVSRIELSFSRPDDEPAELPAYRVALLGYPARVAIELGGIVATRQVGWRASIAAEGQVTGIVVASSPDGFVTFVEAYLKRDCAFRVRESVREGRLTVELQPFKGKPEKRGFGVFLPPTATLGEAFTFVDELRAENLPTALVVDSRGRLRVQVAVLRSHRRAEKLRREVIALEKPGITKALIAPQPSATRPVFRR